MFSFFRKNQNKASLSEGVADGSETRTVKSSAKSTVEFKINGMHCTSCSMTIDGELEDNPGVISANTSYAKGRTSVEFDSSLISQEQLKKIITKLGYEVE